MINKLKNNHGFIKYFINTSWLFAEKILRLVVGLFVGIWIARYLGPDKFGLFSYAQAFVAMFASFVTLGLDDIVVRELVKDKSKKDLLLGTSFVLKLIAALAVLMILALAINFTSNDQYTNLLIFIIASATIFQSFNVIDFYFQSIVLSKYVVYANVISLLLSSIIKIFLILSEAPILYFAIMIAFDSFILAMGLLYYYFHKSLTFKTWKFDAVVAKTLLKESLPLILANVITLLIMRIDQVMIRELTNTVEVGVYAAASRLTEAWYFMVVIISNSIFPAIINAKKHSLKLFNQRVQHLFTLLFVLALIIIIPTQFIANWLIDFLYGEEYAYAGEILVIQIWTIIFVYFGFVGMKWLLLVGKQKQEFYRTLFALVVNILLNYPLIKMYGAIGAAYATLISWITGMYLYHLFHADTRELFYMQTKTLFGISLIQELKSRLKK